MSVLVLNCGSSSVKFRVIGEAEASGMYDLQAGPFRDHASALAAIASDLADVKLSAVAHRVVHGGQRFSAPVLIDDTVLEGIRALSVLAPLHNPVQALGIEVARQAWPTLPHVAVFDTAFHATLPPEAYTYAVPREYGARRYGFHGTSHAYVSREAAQILGRPLAELNLIILHLGNGASACAVAGGRSVETSMGLTPLEGLVMGTRSGDVDPAIFGHLRRVAGLSAERVEEVLTDRSGMLALAGTADLREVHRRIEAGDGGAALALDVYCHRIRKYVGAYIAVLGGADAIVFTAGVGEHDSIVRERSLAGLERLGIAVDPTRNAASEQIISPAGSPLAVLVVPTDEEREMATQTAALVGS